MNAEKESLWSKKVHGAVGTAGCMISHAGHAGSTTKSATHGLSVDAKSSAQILIQTIIRNQIWFDSASQRSFRHAGVERASIAGVRVAGGRPARCTAGKTGKVV